MEARGRHEASARETRWRHEVGNHQGGTSRRHIGISVLKSVSVTQTLRLHQW